MSPLHGSGRSFLKEHMARELSKDPELREKVVKLSTGEIFREIAREKGFDDINAFSAYLREHPEEAERVDTEIDREVKQKVREHVRSGRIVLIDSNLHAWPHALEDVPSVTVLVITRPEVIGERLVKEQRKGERAYNSPEEALMAQHARTRRDMARYILLAERVNDPELRELYRKGARAMGRARRAFLLFHKGLLSPRLARALLGKGIIVVDNSGHIRETLDQLARALYQLAGSNL